MHPLGAWITSTPRLRAARRTSFMRGAISSTRRTALRQWCASHTSQTTTAVARGSQDSVESRGTQSPFCSTRRRVGTTSVASSALAVGMCGSVDQTPSMRITSRWTAAVIRPGPRRVERGAGPRDGRIGRTGWGMVVIWMLRVGMMDAPSVPRPGPIIGPSARPPPPTTVPCDRPRCPRPASGRCACS